MHISSKIMASGDDAKGHRVSVGALEGWKQVLCSCIVHVAFSQCSAYHMTRKKKEEKAVWVFEEANLVSMGLISVIDDYKAVAIYHITGQHCTTSTIFQVVAADVH